MPTTTRRSKSKPAVKFQYGGRPFSESGSSFNSAVDWDISSKFGMQIDFQSLKRVQSQNLNTEVDFQLYGRHLEKSIWRHNSAANRPIMTKFGTQMQKDMPMTTHDIGHNRNLYGGRPLFETGNNYISPMYWDVSSKFGMQMDFRILKRVSLIETGWNFVEKLQNNINVKNVPLYNNV